MDWTSFYGGLLLGGAVVGVLGLFVGIVLGGLAVQSRNPKVLAEELREAFADVEKRLEPGQCFTASVVVSKGFEDNNDGGGDEPAPLPPSKAWRNN